MNPISALGAGDRALLIHAHPDDETLACGATAAELAARGVEVVLATASAGEAAESGDLETARNRRETRLRQAAKELGIGALHRLGGPGRWIDDAGRGGAGSLTLADPAELTDEIAAVIDRVRPAVILTVGTDGITHHPDHRLISRAVAAAVRDGGPPAYGACVLADDVTSAHQRIAEFTDETVGDGGITGVRAETVGLTFTTGTPAGAAKRRALDEYAAGLSDIPLAELFARSGHHGDTELLRVLFDIVGWNIEHYEKLA